MRPIQLQAIANPYGFLDQDGRAQATVMKVGAPTTPIGAMLDRSHPEGEKRQVFKHHANPVRVVASTINQYAYYKRAFEDGNLLPADEATAKILGVKFVEPQAALEAAKAEAIARWKENHGTTPQCDDSASASTAVSGGGTLSPLPSALVSTAESATHPSHAEDA